MVGHLHSTVRNPKPNKQELAVTLTAAPMEYTGAKAMPASVEPTRSLPAVVVSRSRRVEPCSLFWEAAGDVLPFGESTASCSPSSLISLSRANSLFSKRKHLIVKYRKNRYPAFYSEE